MSGLGGRSDDMNINEKHNYNFVNKGYPDTIDIWETAYSFTQFVTTVRTNQPNLKKKKCLLFWCCGFQQEKASKFFGSGALSGLMLDLGRLKII